MYNMLKDLSMNKVLIILSCFSLYLISSEVDHLKVPDGFSLEIFASSIEAPRQIVEGSKGYIFVGSKTGKVYSLRDSDNNGRVDNVEIVAEGLGDSSGVAYHNGTLFIAEIDKIWRIDDIENKLESFNKSPIELVLVTDDLPSDQWHGRKWIMVDDDGSILLNIGAPCNVCLKEDERYATIMRYKENTWKIEARGVRNSVGFDKNPTNNKLYFTDNGRDWLGDSLPSCELNVLEESGDFFGFPYVHADDVIDPDFGNLNHGYEIKKNIESWATCCSYWN